MKNSKYIKVSVSERQPDKDGVYFSWIDNPNAELHLVPEDYNNICRRVVNGKFNSFYDVTDYLIEVPDYEDEMKEMLDRIQDLNILPEEIEDELALLLKKLKS